MTIRAAVIGVNNIGKQHCAAYSGHADVELAAVCDLNEPLARQTAASFRTKYYTDAARMLEQERIDVVSVATGGVENGSHHYGPVVQAIRAGKDVLVEKPISNHIGEAREMVRLAREQGVRLACNLNHRFVPAAAKAKELIDRGELGSLLFLNMKLTIGNKRDDSPWLHMRALHPHSIDIMRYLAGDIRRVQSFMTQAPGRTSWSTVSVNMEFASGAVGHLTGSYDMSMLHPIEHCEAAGTKGRLVIDNVYERLEFYPHEREEAAVFRNSILRGTSGFQDTFRNRLNHWIGEIAAGTGPERIQGSGADALAVQEVIEAAIESHLRNGAAIDVPATTTS